jgi:hypothetical protein
MLVFRFDRHRPAQEGGMQTGKPFTNKVLIIRKTTCKLVGLGIILAAFLWLIYSLSMEAAGTNIRLDKLEDVRISSSEFPYFAYTAGCRQLAAYKKKRLLYKEVAPMAARPLGDYYTFTLSFADRPKVLLHYSPALNEVYSTKELLEVSPDLKEALLDLIAFYRQEIHDTYGALLVWEEVDELFPMYATARIRDLYSGASFYVQRREGSGHVDAQPLTAADTAVMKEIYGGRWSWERKGIIVEVGGYRIAASMNGMPHGSGRIEDNDFPGHFCIHFLGSTIHSGGMDVRHHQEILKAAGKLPLADLEKLSQPVRREEP